MASGCLAKTLRPHSEFSYKPSAYLVTEIFLSRAGWGGVAKILGLSVTQNILR